MFEAPGEQFLLERLRKIEALPPSERPYDAARFLECYRLQEEVAAALPFPAEARASGFGALEPPPEVVSLALLKFLKAYHICSFGFIQINESVKRVFMEITHLLPFPDVAAKCVIPAPGMLQLLDRWEDDSLLTLLQVLCAVFVLRKIPQLDMADYVGRLMAKAARRLATPSCAASYERQLGQLQQSSQQPVMSTKDLQYLALTFQYTALESYAQAAPSGKAAAQAQAARRRVSHDMAALFPENPLAYSQLIVESSSQDKDMWARRGLEAATARGSEWQTIITAMGAAMAMASNHVAETGRHKTHVQQHSPAAANEVRRLLKLAHASFRRIQNLLPTGSIQALKVQLKQADAFCSPLTGHQPSASSREALKADYTTIMQQHCSNCQQASLGLKLCGGCKAAGYCSVECQRAHWRQHKPACLAARQSRAAVREGK